MKELRGIVDEVKGLDFFWKGCFFKCRYRFYYLLLKLFERFFEFVN